MTNSCVIAGRRKTPTKQSRILAKLLDAGLPRAFQSLAMTALLLAFAAPPARAACTDPAGEAGQIVYNADQNVPQFCDGGDWIALGVFNPTAGGGGCTGPAGVEGEVIYNDYTNAPQYCDGDDWREMAGRIVTSAGLSGPSGCPDIGDECSAQGNIIFAGWHPLTQEHLFIPPTDQERPGAPGTYTMNWKNATGTDDIGTDSENDGEVNHANRGGAIGNFQAFQACEDLSFGGKTDWYLPSQAEAYYLWSAHQTIEAKGNITNFQDATYWSSTEYSTGNAWIQDFASGYQVSNSKTTNHRVRCVRR